MGLHLGLTLGNAQPVGPASSITIDTAPAITGTAEVGETLTRTVGSYSGDGTITVSNGRWTRNGVDIAPAQTGATYTLVAADDQTTVRWYEDVADAGSGDTITAQSNGLYVTYAAPTATGGLSDQSFTEDTGAQTYDVSGDFTNAAGGTWSLPTTIAGVTINSSGVVSFNTDTLALQTGTSIVARYTNSGGFANSGFSLAITVAPAVATLSFTSAGPQETDGDVPISYTISANDTVELVLFAAAEADPGAADFDGGGAPTYIDLGPASLTTGGSAIDVSIPSDLSGSYKIAGLPSGGGDVDVAVSAAFTVDTVASVLSSPTDAADGETASTGSVSTNEGDGTLYWVITQSATSPSAAQIQAGNDHTGTTADDSGSQAVSGTGAQNMAGSGLTASTGYYTHFVQVDSTGNVSNVASASGFTTTTPDVTAPTLSSPTAAKSGETGATSLGVSTNEGNGTLYWGIYPTASTPSAADVVAGTGATVNGSQAVSGTGVQSVSDQTGLTAGTAYKAHYVQDDAASNRSSVATSSEFTTDAAASDPAGDILTLLGADVVGLQDGTDWSNMWQDTAGTTAVTAAGQPVRRLDDLSGNGNHWLAISGNAIAQTGYLDFNGAAFQISGAISGGEAGMEVYALIDPADDPDDWWVLLGRENLTGFFAGIAHSGGSGNVSDGFVGTKTSVVDNVVGTQTRNALYTDMATGGYKAQGVRDIGFTAGITNVLPLAYASAFPIPFAGRMKLFLFAKALTTGERSDLQDIFDGAK